MDTDAAENPTPAPENADTNNSPQADSVPEAPLSTLRRLANYGLRIAAAFAMAATMWILVGSIWFPAWWYEAIFRGQIVSGSFLSFAIGYLVGNQLWLLFSVIGLGVVAIIGSKYWSRGFRHIGAFIDKLAFQIVGVCFLILCSIGIILVRTQDEPNALILWQWGVKDWAANLMPTTPPPREIESPVDFHYIDGDRVTAIYSEIEPELIESKKTVSNNHKAGVTAEVGVAANNLKGESSTTKEETSEYERSDFSADRKCIELMNFGLRKGSTHYFTNLGQYYQQFGIEMDSPHSTDAEEKALTARINEANQSLQNDLAGFLIVEGVFHIKRENNAIQFEEEFSSKPMHVIFHFSLPERNNSEIFQNGRKLRVFGDVIQTDQNGKIEIHPIAIF